MKPKIREILARCIESGISTGINRAHKHTDAPTLAAVESEIDSAIWMEIDGCFDFEEVE